MKEQEGIVYLLITYFNGEVFGIMSRAKKKE
jgi:hypothetical protein